MELINKIKPYISKGILATAIATGGCAANNNPHFTISNTAFLPNGYKSTKDTQVTLRTLAGVICKTVKVEKTRKGNIIEYFANGTYSQGLHPNAFNAVMKAADLDKNKVITEKEARDLQLYLYEKFAE